MPVQLLRVHRLSDTVGDGQFAGNTGYRMRLPERKPIALILIVDACCPENQAIRRFSKQYEQINGY